MVGDVIGSVGFAVEGDCLVESVKIGAEKMVYSDAGVKHACYIGNFLHFCYCQKKDVGGCGNRNKKGLNSLLNICG